MMIRKRTVGSCVVLFWDAPLNLEGAASARLKEALQAAIRDGASRLVLDLGRVEFVDSSGLGALISALKALRSRGGAFALAQVSEPVDSILKITRLIRVFDTHDSVEEACAWCESVGVME